MKKIQNGTRMAYGGGDRLKTIVTQKIRLGDTMAFVPRVSVLWTNFN